jgi:hypothetical protein
MDADVAKVLSNPIRFHPYPQGRIEHFTNGARHPPPCPPPLEDSKGVQTMLEAQSSRLRVCAGVQKQSALKPTPRLHTGSVLDIPYMVEKIISIRFQWLWSQAQMLSESTGIVRKS